MKAMMLESAGTPLKLVERPDPIPGAGEIRLKVEACAVCRTDLHVVDGDLRHPKLPLVPGHEIVGIIDLVGEGVSRSRLGQRVGVPGLGTLVGIVAIAPKAVKIFAISHCSPAIRETAASPAMSSLTRSSLSIWTRMLTPYRWRPCFALA